MGRHCVKFQTDDAKTRPSAVLLLTALLSVLSGAVSANSDELLQQLMSRLEQQERDIDQLRQEIEKLKAAPEALPAAASPDDSPQTALLPNDEPQVRVLPAAEPGTQVKLSGRVHRMLQYADDGLDTQLFHTDSDQGPTMFRIDADSEITDRLKLGATIEVGLQQGRPLNTSQDQEQQAFEVTGRIMEFRADSNDYGKLSIGRGFMSSWYVPETDLSGTQLASLLSPGMLFGGLKFVDTPSMNYSNIQVRNYFFDSERLLLKNRLRYDSIRFSKHTSAGLSFASDDGWDISLRTRYEPGDFSIVAATSYQNEPFFDIDRRWDGAVSARHEPSGLNITLGGFISQAEGDRDPTSWVIKLGWFKKFSEVGATALSTDYSHSDDVAQKNDQGNSWGAFAMQNWDAYHLKLYTGIRRYEIKIPGRQLEPITVIPVGVVYAF